MSKEKSFVHVGCKRPWVPLHCIIRKDISKRVKIWSVILSQIHVSILPDLYYCLVRAGNKMHCFRCTTDSFFVANSYCLIWKQGFNDAAINGSFSDV